MLSKVQVEVSVILGTATVPIHQLLRMGRGAVIELDATEHDDVEILANNIPVAKGQVQLQDERISVTITEVLTRNPVYRPRDATKVIA